MGDGQLLRKEASDIGKSLRALVDSGSLNIKMDYSVPPPSGIRWQTNGDHLIVHLRKAITPYILVVLPPFLFAVFVGFLVPADLVTTVAVIVLPCALYVPWLLVSYRIQVEPRGVSITHHLGPVPLWRRSLALDVVEDVVIGPTLLSWAAVFVESGSHTLKVRPLGNPAAEWLARFLRSAIATAPENRSN